VVFFEVKVIYAFVHDDCGRQAVNIFVVDAIHIIASCEQLYSVFSFRRVVEKDMCMRFQYHTICLKSANA
jgi:hypothetical protein